MCVWFYYWCKLVLLRQFFIVTGKMIIRERSESVYTITKSRFYRADGKCPEADDSMDLRTGIPNISPRGFEAEADVLKIQGLWTNYYTWR